jgi:hypothetical protein
MKIKRIEIIVIEFIFALLSIATPRPHIIPIAFEAVRN